MELNRIEEVWWEVLNHACGGVFDSLKAHCEAHGHEAHLTVQTDIEGLPHGEMKLFIHVVDGNDTKDFAQARMEGSAKIIGWNIYLHDRLSSARNHLNRAQEKMAQAGAAGPVTVTTPASFEELKALLN